MHITETDIDVEADRAGPQAAPHPPRPLAARVGQGPAATPPAPAGLTLQVRGVSVARARDGELRHLSFDIGPGEIIAVLGARGSGIELLARVLAGELPPDGGQVLHDGTPPPAGSRQLHLQHRHGHLHRWRLWLLKRALARSPRALLLDRSFEGLDALQRVQLKQRIEAHWLLQRCTTLIFTHDLRDALALADRVLRIDGGRLVGDEPLDLPRPRVFSGDDEAVASWVATTGCAASAPRRELEIGALSAREVLRYPF